MSKKLKKFQVCCYFIGGLLFLVAGLRYAFLKKDTVGTIIYSINTLLFFVLAFVHYRQMK